MEKKPVLVIMAAGMGSRYGGLKQIDPVDHDGDLIIDFSIFDAKEAGFEKVVFIIKKAIEKGISKVNIFTDINIAAVEAEFSAFDNMNKGVIDLIPAAVNAVKSQSSGSWSCSVPWEKAGWMQGMLTRSCSW